MDDDRIVISSSAAISPEAVAGKGFTTVLRGYQPAEVRQFLKRVAEEVGAAAAREAELRRALHDAQNRAAHPELDEAALTSSLGEHAGRLIASARETAAAITAEAERTAAATLRDAEYRIARIRQEADTLMARRVDEADGVSSSLRQSAEADARAIRDQAQGEAEAAIQAARSHGKEMVAEARAVRERMLGDLARRRRVAEVQLEQLRVARERLVQAYDVVRHTLEEATAELAAAEPEARLAAEEVGRRMSDADAHPPLRVASAGGGSIPPPPPPGTGLPPLGRRPDGPSRVTDLPSPRSTFGGPSPLPPVPPLPPAHSPSSFQPTQPAPPLAPAPAAPVSDRPERPERPPVPPGWIERAGGTGGSGRISVPPPPPPPPPPPAAGPVLVPAAGIGGGPPTEPVFDPADPGTWAGAGFGLPRDKPGTSRPADASDPSGGSGGSGRFGESGAGGSADPGRSGESGRSSEPGRSADPGRSGESGRSADPGRSGESGRSSGSAAARPPSGTDASSPPPSTAAGAVAPPDTEPSAPPAPPPWSAPAGGAQAHGTQTPGGSPSGPAVPPPPPAPDRPPLRPQTVADSVPFRSQPARPAPSPTAGPGTPLRPPGTGSDAPGAVRTGGPSRSVTGLRPLPPDLPLAVPAAAPQQPPELATAEQPAVPITPSAPVDELFARLRHQADTEPPPPPTPTPTPAPSSSPPTDAVVDEAALAQRDEQLDPLDADLTRALKRILQDEQNGVLERLREGGRAGASSVLGAVDDQASSFTAAAAPALAAAYRAGGGATSDIADDTTGFALGGKLANDLAGPLRERLDRVLATAGDDMEELAEAVRAAYRQAKLQEIEQLVRHHTAAAHALGAYAATSGRTLLRWVVDDEGPCPDCYDNTLAGPTPKGQPFPTGQDHPPAHLGCRCLLVPVST